MEQKTRERIGIVAVVVFILIMAALAMTYPRDPRYNNAVGEWHYGQDTR